SFSLPPPHPRPTLFPYTTLFRSERRVQGEVAPRRLRHTEPREAAIDLRNAPGGGQLDRAQRSDGVVRVSAIERERHHQICERERDRKSTRLNSSHVAISYAVFCL